MQRHIIELKRVDGINEITKKVIPSNHKTFELELDLNLKVSIFIVFCKQNIVVSFIVIYSCRNYKAFFKLSKVINQFKSWATQNVSGPPKRIGQWPGDGHWLLKIT